MGKTYKDLKKQGKHVFDGPEVKQRKHFAPATKTEPSGKQYKRKGKTGNAFEEDSEDESTDEAKRCNDESRKECYESDIPKDKTPVKRKGSKDFRKEYGIDEDEDGEKACWKGYEKKGTKKKGGKTVNNCVKIANESHNLSKFIEAIMTSNHAQAHKQLKNAINSKIQKRIAQEIDKPLF